MPSGRAIRDTVAAELGGAYAALPSMTFARPVSARHWLQASNPSERWKWDFMFQDLPPIKFGDDFGPLPRADALRPGSGRPERESRDVIPLKEVK
jgi:hypothetical protein